MKDYSIRVATALPRRGSAGERLQHWISIAGPIGLIPWVPATFASLATAAVCRWFPPSHWAALAVALALFGVGARTATTSERLLGIKDPRNVVIDEVLGQVLTFLFVAPASWLVALAGFALFRLFDVVKPPPARQAERLTAGWGIMADDFVAGLYAAAALWLLARVLA